MGEVNAKRKYKKTGIDISEKIKDPKNKTKDIREYQKKYQREYRKKNLEAIREYQRNYMKVYNQKKRDESKTPDEVKGGE